MEYDLIEMLAAAKKKEELAAIVECNSYTAQFGLSLSKEEAGQLMEARNTSLRQSERIEFGKGICVNIIETFCDSQYLNQSGYADTLMELQDIFYVFKNEAMDLLTDEELLNFMKEQFEEICCGDTDYLADTCLERFTRAVRAGYSGYQATDGTKSYEAFDEEPRWDKELYQQVLRELFWQ